MSAAAMRAPMGDEFAAMGRDLRDAVRRVCELADAGILQAMILYAAANLGGNPKLAMAGARDAASVRLREVAVYLAHTKLGLPQERAGRAVGLTRSGATRAIQRVEELRDEPGFNWQLHQIEQALEE